MSEGRQCPPLHRRASISARYNASPSMQKRDDPDQRLFGRSSSLKGHPAGRFHPAGTDRTAVGTPPTPGRRGLCETGWPSADRDRKAYKAHAVAPPRSPRRGIRQGAVRPSRQVQIAASFRWDRSKKGPSPKTGTSHMFLFLCSLRPGCPAGLHGVSP